MKKILTFSILTSIFLMAGTPIHDLMDNRIKGKSYTGSLDDNVAAEDGLGVLPLQHHTGTTELNNELLVQKVFNRIVHTETDRTKTINIKTSLTNGTVGTVSDLSILNNVGVTLGYPSGTLSSCKEIKTQYPSSTDGVYSLNLGFDVYCDMTTDGGGWTMVLNYLHKGNTNPNLNVKVNNGVLLGSTSLGIDESTNSTTWGHMSSATINKFNFSETQWFCKSSFHSRVVHFKTTHSSIVNYMKTGSGAFVPYYADTGYITLLPKYSNASIPLYVNSDRSGYSNQGDYSITEFPIYGNSTIGNPRAHWGIHGLGDRWECDDQLGVQGAPNSYYSNTHHQMFIR